MCKSEEAGKKASTEVRKWGSTVRSYHDTPLFLISRRSLNDYPSPLAKGRSGGVI